MATVTTFDVVGLARSLIDIDSTTGSEGPVVRWLADWLRARGFTVETQPVEGERVNLYVTLGDPVVVLSTHLDCVPPFFPSREDGGLLYGRGACDAKGIAAAQVGALEQLRAAGETRVGLLFVVGEERGSHGAHAANQVPPGSRYLVDGEPTDNRLGAATRGVCRVKLLARGRAAHSSHPEQGESAIEKLVDALVALRTLELPRNPTLGTTTYTVCLIDGGVAPNVGPPTRERRGQLPHRRPGVSGAGGARAGDGAGRDRGCGRGATDRDGDGAGVRNRSFPFHDRHPVSLGLGAAAALRAWLGAGRPHRRGARAGWTSSAPRSTTTCGSRRPCWSAPRPAERRQTTSLRSSPW